MSNRIPDRVYFRIGDVAELVGVKPYVIRYWETEFKVVAPDKSATGQRVYRRTDVETLILIKHLLYEQRYSIEGARKRINELRREGELKSFREAQVVAATRNAEVAGKLTGARATAAELEGLACKPIGELFRLG